MRDKFLALPLVYKAAVIATAFCLLANLVLILASHQGQNQLISHSTELFGESLVQQLSREASSPLVQGDRLSLQALLNELVESPLVVHGAIYDLENRPIAEAGKPAQGKDISASITFQDSIAGYAVITFDTSPLRQQAGLQSWQLLTLAILLAALVFVLAQYPGRQLSAIINDLTVVALTPLKRRRSNTHIAYHGTDELLELSEALLSGPEESSHHTLENEYAVLMFEITNLPSLQVNLGQQALANALATLRKKLTTLCRLYDGELEACRSNSFVALFPAGEEDSYPFRALCSAFLIEQSLHGDDSLFQFRQAITTNSMALCRLEPVTGKQRCIEQALLQAGVAREGVLINDNIAHHASVRHRIHTTTLGDGISRVDALEQNYQQLLERQLLTLRQN